MKVGVTATQQGLTDRQKEAFIFRLIELGAIELHHGDCIGGDSDLHDVARRLGLRIVVHPPVDPKKRAFRQGDEIRPQLPYLDRNKKIVLETDILLAGPKTPYEMLRSGTWSTVRFARRRKRRFEIIEP